MQELTWLSKACLYVLLGIMGALSVVIGIWQTQVMRGKALKNCDGTFDSWQEQKIHYGIAFADVFLACPANLAGITLIFLSPRWGHYLLNLVSFWWVWANLMTTATSLRFAKPKLTCTWFLVFPFGSVVGLAYIAWSILHFEAIFLR
jgi:hypothetical protein